jgi:hypothetical protein
MSLLSPYEKECAEKRASNEKEWERLKPQDTISILDAVLGPTSTSQETLQVVRPLPVYREFYCVLSRGPIVLTRVGTPS